MSCSRSCPALAVLVLVSTGVSAPAQCGSQWSNQFGVTQLPATAMVTHDDGSGPALYVGVSTSSGSPLTGVYRWRGPGFDLEPVGQNGGVQPLVSALAVYDDGTGPALYACGGFTVVGGLPIARIAKWNGSSWTALGAGLDGTAASLSVYDPGSGPALYVGGRFATAGGVASPAVAKWNGTTWSAATTSVTNVNLSYPASVDSLAVYDPGTGPRLYAGGNLASVNGVNVNGVGSFDGSTWAPLGLGVAWPGTGLGAYPSLEMQVFDGGAGPELYVGGSISSAGGATVASIARWNGTSWSGVGGGVTGTITTLATWTSPAGQRLVVGGGFSAAGGVTTITKLALWSGTAWSAAGAPGHVPTVSRALDFGAGEHLYMFGYLNVTVPGGGIGGIEPIFGYFQAFDGQKWFSARGHGLPLVHPVHEFARHDDGTGPQLYAVGEFVAADANPMLHVARWNGTAWSSVGTGVAPLLNAVTSIATGPFAGLYAGGGWDPSVAAAGTRVYKWDGIAWTLFGPFFDMPTLWTLTSFDAGGGPVPIVGGNFLNAGGSALNCVAYWNGSTWAPLGLGVSGTQPGLSVYALKIFDDGTGPALYAGGFFQSAGGAPASSIAKWNGTAWSPLGSGVTAPVLITGPVATVYALEVFDDGTGPALYAGGYFTTAGGIPASNVAKWNGTAWSPLGAGTSGGGAAVHAGAVTELRAFNDGSGPRLYAGGYFSAAGGTLASRIAYWDGASWNAIGSGLSLDPLLPQSSLGVHAIEAFDPGNQGASLFVGGRFDHAGGYSSWNVAEIVPSRPGLALTQLGGPGSGIAIWNTNLTVGSEYFNVFSLQPAPGGPGTGPYLGLHATNIAPLVAQVVLPVGAVPFHFIATNPTVAFGPYQGAPGLTIEGVCFDFTGNTLGCVSVVPRLNVQ